MKIDKNYIEHLASQGIIVDLIEPIRYLWDVAENVYAMAFNANCYSHIRTLLLQQWQQHKEILCVSGAFIHYTVNSLTTSMMMDVCKIYDPDENSKTIYLLDKKTKLIHISLPTSYSRSFEELYKDIENSEDRASVIKKLKDDYEIYARNELAKLGENLHLLDSIAKNAMKQRNKLYAHNDFLNEQQETNYISRYPVKLSDINKLIDFALYYSTTIIALIIALNRPKVPVNINDFEGLMQYILKGRETIETKMNGLVHE
jgi:hypothetical protein